MDSKKEIEVRIYFIVAVFVLFVLAIVFKLIQIGVLEQDYWQDFNKKHNRLVWKAVESERGNILADDGLTMWVTTNKIYNIYFDPLSVDSTKFFRNIDNLSSGLFRLIDGKLSAGDWKNRLISARRAGKRHIEIARKIGEVQKDHISQLPLFDLGRYKGGLIITPISRREKLYLELASRTLGIDRENHRVGIEHSYNKYLNCDSTKYLMKKIPGSHASGGPIWIPLHQPSKYEFKKGKDVVTTLNVELQEIVYNELKNGLKTTSATSGTAILMDVKSGAIKAISNLTLQADGSFAEVENFGIYKRRQPGSTIKAITALALFESGLIDINDPIDISNGVGSLYGTKIFDSHTHHHRTVPFHEAFAMSSNVGLAYAADKVWNNTEGYEKFYRQLNKFRLTKKTHVDLFGEPSPVIKDPKLSGKDKASYWSKITLPWMAHGYELLLTPLQILSFYNTIANDGYAVQPVLVTEIKENNISIKKRKLVRSKQRIAKIENIKKVQDLLLEVVETGTGAALKSPFVNFSGKTGTASLGTQLSLEKLYDASFVGYFPSEKPKYSLIVIAYDLDKSNYYGSTVAGPIFKNIVENVVSKSELDVVQTKKGYEIPSVSSIFYRSNGGNLKDFKAIFEFTGQSYNIRTHEDWGTISPAIDQFTITGLNQRQTINGVPNVIGMGMRDAIYILEKKGFSVKSFGEGKVIKQEFEENNPKKILLFFE